MQKFRLLTIMAMLLGLGWALSPPPAGATDSTTLTPLTGTISVVQDLTISEDTPMTIGLVSKPSTPTGCTRFIINSSTGNIRTDIGCVGGGLNDGHVISGHSRGEFTISGSPNSIFDLTAVSTSCSTTGIQNPSLNRVPGPYTLDGSGNFPFFFLGMSVEVKGDADPPGGEFTCNYSITFGYN